MGISTERRGRGQRRRQSQGLIQYRFGTSHVVVPRCATSAAVPRPRSTLDARHQLVLPSSRPPSLWPTLCVPDYNLSLVQSSPIVSSSTPLLQPLQYPPLSSMPSKIIATSTP